MAVILSRKSGGAGGGGGPPSGPAGGNLAGTYPNPTFNTSVVTPFALTVLDDTTAEAARTTLGVMRELSYVEFTAPVSITATTEATANTVVTAAAVTGDAATVMLIEFFTVAATSPSSNVVLNVWLYDGASSIGKIGAWFDTAGQVISPGHIIRRLTPSAASHTYSVRASVGSGTGSIEAGAGGTGNLVPGFIRITTNAT